MRSFAACLLYLLCMLEFQHPVNAAGLFYVIM
jgi:hypothetical protein